MNIRICISIAAHAVQVCGRNSSKSHHDFLNYVICKHEQKQATMYVLTIFSNWLVYLIGNSSNMPNFMIIMNNERRICMCVMLMHMSNKSSVSLTKLQQCYSSLAKYCLSKHMHCEKSRRNHSIACEQNNNEALMNQMCITEINNQ